MAELKRHLEGDASTASPPREMSKTH
jgi:hypothetical protein